MKSPETYYRDHWVTIEPDRLDAYEQMFRWRPEMDALIASGRGRRGQSVLDFGCGPGWLAIELARRVGPSGHVHALDVNQAFLERAAAHVAAEGLQSRVGFHHVTDERIPLADRTLDRVVTKNVLEYVADLQGDAGRDAPRAEARRPRARRRQRLGNARRRAARCRGDRRAVRGGERRLPHAPHRPHALRRHASERVLGREDSDPRQRRHPWSFFPDRLQHGELRARLRANGGSEDRPACSRR